MDNWDIAMSHNHGFKGEEGIDFVRFNLAWLTDGRENINEPNKQISHPPGEENPDRTIWIEDFDGPDGNSISHGKFRALDSGNETFWESGNINIADAESISIAVDAIKIGNLNKSDYLRIYYKLGNHDEVLLHSLSFSNDPQEDFETYQVQKRVAVSAPHTQVQIIIRARVNGANKALYWDRVRVYQ